MQIAAIRVWDPFVRLFHWSLALSFAIAWFSANSSNDLLHSGAGYAAGALVLARIAWGIVGTPYARFSQFIRSPRRVLAYLRAIAQKSEQRYVGHNPAGGAMVIALFLAITATSVSGWALTTDAFWGVTWMQRLHDGLARGLLLMVCAHLAGVILASFRHRENLIAAMINGRKRAAEQNDVE
ncbi:MAG TPA: cytochrome b/b6 domain-containing protein [Roseiarcus sp.]|nr:cytochrome b/b6 domain-containing protein [Roseiarcus sp.]